MKKVVKILLPFIVASTALFSGCKNKDKDKEDKSEEKEVKAEDGEKKK